MKILICLILLTTIFPALSYSQTDSESIVGEWLSAKKDSRVLIYRRGTTYFGKITWGKGTSTKDEKNPNPSLRDRNLIGLVILSGLTYDGRTTWDGGSIYDPREGKTYACKVTLNTPESLSIRGYVGVSLFGRTDIWFRINNSSSPELK